MKDSPELVNGFFKDASSKFKKAIMDDNNKSSRGRKSRPTIYMAAKHSIISGFPILILCLDWKNPTDPTSSF